MGKIKVLVVDDSMFALSVITKKLEEDPEITVVGRANNGIEAVQRIKELCPDVVTLDVAMPVMDGITALEHIMEECPVPVIMLSALTTENADVTVRALELGAVDFFLKPSILTPAGDGEVSRSLIEKIKIAAKVGAYTHRYSFKDQYRGNINSINSLKNSNAIPLKKIIVIGSSTGGPRALMQLLPGLPSDLPVCVLIVQHMPPVFTKSLAERLSNVSRMKVKEAQDGDRIEQGSILLAPGGYHMVISKQKKIVLTQDPPVLGVRPSVDITMKSAVEVFGKAVMGVILTGMNTDGTKGASLIKQAGGIILAQDESTSVVFGMPKSVIEAGYADKVLPIQKIAGQIIHICNEDTDCNFNLR